MTDDELAAIQERAKYLRSGKMTCSACGYCPDCQTVTDLCDLHDDSEDVPALLAEVERLRADTGRPTGETHCRWCFGCNESIGSCRERPCYQAVRPEDEGPWEREVPLWGFHDRTCPLGDEHTLAVGG